jgi:hypothetical protein
VLTKRLLEAIRRIPNRPKPAAFFHFVFLAKYATHAKAIIQLIGKSIKSIILDSVKNIVFLKLRLLKLA